MKFDWYYEPTTIEQCVQLLNEYGTDAKLLAGGTDLVVKMRNRLIKIKTMISLNGIQELGRVSQTENGVLIGAMSRLMDVSKSKQLSGYMDVVAKGAGHVSSMQVRNVATIGGNSCNASPCADTVPPLYVCDAIAQIAGPGGKRTIPVEHFFTGPGQTVLENGEMLTGYVLPDLGDGNGTAFIKYSIRGDTDISIVSVAVRLKLGTDGKIEEARVALGSVAPTVIRVPEAESLLVGKALTSELIAQASQAAAGTCKPITDARGSAGYRKEMIRVWTKHALTEAFEKAK